MIVKNYQACPNYMLEKKGPAFGLDFLQILNRSNEFDLQLVSQVYIARVFA